MRGPKTRFAEDAIAHGLDSAVSKFPDALNADGIAKLRAVTEKELKVRLKELFAYWQEFDDALDD
jgi:hypothetical protein